ncbi:MAG TPA: cysteine--tRNA ligase [Streptosporangiaceae bacterium]|nr:cysteine--tRNA ligase [Streptosporangiaceae bacterium]
MTLRLHDTATRSVREFVPNVPGQVGLYLCGATVQAPPHIGHIRSGVSFDVIVRWLKVTGLAVTFCRNVTDIDDKILRVADAEGSQWWAVAERNQRAFSRAYDGLGCLPPDVEPRATGHVPEMITLMRRLIDAGHAYAAGGDVFFDVSSLSEYGALSGQRPEHMRAADDVDGESHKRDPRDFALWKGKKPGEPAWDTPWGEGRPGWHLECSAMATKYLGTTFDIHGGGLDLIFPHHENELAQSTGAGDGFARYWLHNGLVRLSGEKMSKSLGNSLLVDAMVTKVRPAELRYYLVQAHYRSDIEYSEQALAEAVAAYRRIEGFVTRAQEATGRQHAATAEGALPGASCGLPMPSSLPAAFASALDDDFGVPAALAVVHEAVRDGNAALAAGDVAGAAKQLESVLAMLAVLGLDPLAAPFATGAGGDLTAVVDALVGVALKQRQAARSRKDYAAADAIRDQLAAAGVVVEDTPAGSRWELAR